MLMGIVVFRAVHHTKKNDEQTEGIQTETKHSWNQVNGAKVACHSSANPLIRWCDRLFRLGLTYQIQRSDLWLFHFFILMIWIQVWDITRQCVIYYKWDERSINTAKHVRYVL